MSKIKKRHYRSEVRSAKAAQTKKSILVAAKNLFELEGFEFTTIEKIAQTAGVSIPTVYSLFQSKRGILRALMDDVFPKEQFDALVKMSTEASSPKERLRYAAKIARHIYEAEKAQMDIFRGAVVLAPEFKELEKERERRRHARQEATIKALKKEKALSKNLSLNKARDILWAFTGRDLYRMLVVEQQWSPAEYEGWLAELLATTLLNGKAW